VRTVLGREDVVTTWSSVDWRIRAGAVIVGKRSSVTRIIAMNSLTGETGTSGYTSSSTPSAFISEPTPGTVAGASGSKTTRARSGSFRERQAVDGDDDADAVRVFGSEVQREHATHGEPRFGEEIQLEVVLLLARSLCWSRALLASVP
jgi:hypothetical protein